MTTLEASPMRGNAEMVEDLDSLGVINALERTCELESKLRQAIQQTHPLTTTLDWDFNAADREREALLAISEQLEYLEDKLREYRFLGAANTDQKAVLLGQLDAVRKELLDVVSINSTRVIFAKEIVREVFLFANAGDDASTSTSTPSPSPPSTSKGKQRSGSGGKHQSRHPPQPILTESSSLFSLISNSPKPTTSRQPSYISNYENELWDGVSTTTTSTTRRDKLAVPVPGSTTGGVASVLEREYDVNGRRASSRRYGASGRSGGDGGASASASAAAQITDEDIYGPPLPPKSSFFRKSSKLSRQPSTNDIATAAATAGTVTATAAEGGAETSAAPAAAQPNGGMVRIREMLSRAEKELSQVAEKQEQRRAPPRILGDTAGTASSHHHGHNSHTNHTGTEEWDGIGTDGVSTGGPPSSYFQSPRTATHTGVADDVVSLWGGMSSATTPQATFSEWTIKAEPTQQHHGYEASSSLIDDATKKSETRAIERSGGGGLGGFFGKVAGLAFILGSVVAATAVATGQLPIMNNTGDNADKDRNRTTGNRRGSISSASRKKGDVPPWEGGNGVARRPKSKSGRVRATATAGTTTAPATGPVMHVHQPPSSGSFPSPPPDVSVAMG